MKASLLSSESDTASMLRVDDEDTLGFSNFSETMLKDVIEEEKSCWCWRRKKSITIHSEPDSSFGFMHEESNELQSEY